MNNMDDDLENFSEPPRIRLNDEHSHLSHFMLTWPKPVVDKARHDILNIDDLGPPPSWLATKLSTDRFLYLWRKSKHTKRGWFWLLFKFARRDYLCSFLASAMCEVCFWSQAPLIDRLVSGIKDGAPWKVLYQYTGLITILLLLRPFLFNYAHGKLYDTGYVTRASIMGAIYRKALQFANGPRQKYCGGKGINVLTLDTHKIYSIITYANFFWLVPLKTIFAFACAYYYMGKYALPAIAFVVLMMSTLYLMAGVLKTKRRHLAEATDLRMGRTQESLQGIKVVKYLALEDGCASKIEAARNDELRLLFNVNGIGALCGALNFWVPLFATAISITLLSLYGGGNIQPGRVIAFIQVFSSLTIPIWILPNLVAGVVATKVSIKRIEQILMADTTRMEGVEEKEGEGMEDGEIMIKVTEGYFKWDAPPPDPKKKKKKRTAQVSIKPMDNFKIFSLKNINLQIPRGSLVAVIGKTCSGKTCLISAILGEMKILDGSRKVNGSVGICEQSAWLIQGTVRENILFGLPFDPIRYATVLRQCSLEADMAKFPAGDGTMIGERGATVSGGQRQRIGLARVAYAQPDIALLDDPLSAVDANVGQALFFDCIKSGTLSHTTRILTTHHTRFLSSCDLIIAMDEGRLVAIGTFQELLNSKEASHAMIRGMLLKSPVYNDQRVSPGGIEVAKTTAAMTMTAEIEEDYVIIKDENQYREDVCKSAKKEAIQAYYKAFGGFWPFLILISVCLAAEVFKVAREKYLKLILSTAEGCSKGACSVNDQLYSSIMYTLISTVQGFASAGSSILAVYLCQKASRKIHIDCINRVLAARLSVFDITPVGRILNRFGRDLDSIDSNFPDRLSQFIVCMSALISTTFLLSVNAPEILPSMILPIISSLFLLRQFIRAWRQTQQLMGISLGPIISHFTESLAGLTTIRTFRQEDCFVKRFDRSNDLYAYCSIYIMAIRRWLSIRVEAIWILYSALVILQCIWFGVPADVVGLIITYVLGTIDSVDWSMRQFAELESGFISVDRLHQYIMGLETEDEGAEVRGGGGGGGGLVSNGLCPENWPSDGCLEFRNVTIQYKPTLPIVIDDFNFVFPPGKRVAIVGRSGAGKSTIIAALFRFTNLSKGSILIDGVDISSVSMKHLRKSLAMVPQDPVLFSGTLRSNLDPLEKHSDATIWNILSKVKMRDAINEYPQKLELLIDESGSGLFSIGQRQLLCLARALLRGANIIVMDEATSNIDRETEALMQASLIESFATATVITIAHRLETILDYDTIIVMGSGRILESGNPKELAKEGGEFSKMMKAASLE